MSVAIKPRGKPGAVDKQPRGENGYKFPSVSIGDCVMFSSGPEDSEWSPFYITKIHRRVWQEQVLDKNGEPVIDKATGAPVMREFDEPYALGGAIIAHTDAAILQSKKTVYHLDSPYIKDNPGLWAGITNNFNQGVFKLSESTLRMQRLEETVERLQSILAKIAQVQDQIAARQSK